MGKRSRLRLPSSPEEIAKRRAEERVRQLEAAARERAQERQDAKSPGVYQHLESEGHALNKNVGRGWGPRQTGLSILARKYSLKKERVAAGERYGLLARISWSGEGRIRSHLDDSGGGHRPEVSPGAADMTEAARLDAIRELAYARAQLGFDPLVTLSLDNVCGKGWAPYDITRVQREAEAVERAVIMALPLLTVFFRRYEVKGADFDDQQDMDEDAVAYHRMVTEAFEREARARKSFGLARDNLAA